MRSEPATNIFNKLKMSAKPIPPVPREVWEDPIFFIAFGFGSGTLPIAPGTFGTLMAIPLYLLICHLPLPVYLGFVVVAIIAAIFISDYVSKKIKIHDHPGMCIDEFVGFLVTMVAVPVSWGYILLGFLFFRLFDIWKPGPIGYLDEHVHGGFGMILDDVAAGVVSMFILQLIHFVS